MLGETLGQAGIFALVSIFMGLLPLGLGLAYAVFPNEQRLALMRPVSLATIFAAISGTVVGVLNVLRGIGMSGPSPELHRAAIGLAEALVPIFIGFGCLTVAWLCVAVGLWRRP